MKVNQVFIGNIRKCILYRYESVGRWKVCFDDSFSIGGDTFGHIIKDDVLQEENVVLFKYKNYGYVDVRKCKTIFDLIRIRKQITKNGWRLGGPMMPEYAYKEDGLFVDASSLKPFYIDSEQKEISLRKLRRQEQIYKEQL